MKSLEKMILILLRDKELTSKVARCSLGIDGERMVSLVKQETALDSLTRRIEEPLMPKT